jgi:molybdopterin/thiamine biosynthesis adenylyltransferase
MDSDTLTPKELRRYHRQVIVPGIGIKGQELLKKSSVLIVGAGGLGCPALQYLTAAGIGKIGIVEFDMVDESNLQRQILYGTMDIGKLKSIIVKDRLKYLNDLISFEIYNLKLVARNALSILGEYDLIIDATDNYGARYLINDACVILNKPMVHGAICLHESQVSVFNYHGGPTYRCYNPYDDKKYLNPESAETGLFGVLPGITGTYMASEVIKIITGVGDVLSGKMLCFNIMNYNTYIISINNVPENHNIKELQNEY